ncbi:hypothetical protein [Xenorhabdus sp. KJ12.1]|uniref:hypothetical protein n=1 Tax=Xenorhabdus sp. KJ12.1 TaxID=1851571 RepID=UPI000C0673EE|nr:lysine 2,3-aminomutase [Xenorhabdus sp. KJ12.1]
MKYSHVVPHSQQILTTSTENWIDWRWQQKNAIRDEEALRLACGGWSEEITQRIQQNLQGQKMQITPYYPRRILVTSQSDDITTSPLWRQVVPFWSEEKLNGYDGESENWELNHEMKTPICQHKYDNRVILRMVTACNSYCQFCFEALRTLKVDSEKSNAGRSSFRQSIEYIKATIIIIPAWKILCDLTETVNIVHQSSMTLNIQKELTSLVMWKKGLLTILLCNIFFQRILLS